MADVELKALNTDDRARTESKEDRKRTESKTPRGAKKEIEYLPWDTLPRIPPKELFPGVGKLPGIPILLEDPSSPTLTSRLASLGTEAFSFTASLFPKRLGRAVVGWSFQRRPIDPRKGPEKEWYFNLVLLPRVVSKGIAWATAYFRAILILLLLVFIGGLVYAQIDPPEPRGFTYDYDGVYTCIDTLLTTSLQNASFAAAASAPVWPACEFDQAEIDFRNLSFAEEMVCNFAIQFSNANITFTKSDEDPLANYINAVLSDPQFKAVATQIVAFDNGENACYEKNIVYDDPPPGPVNLTGLFAAGMLMTAVVMGSLISMHSVMPGTLAFLRSLGKPEVEEFMLSYAWAKEGEPDFVRTIAKAIWNSGVGCWIDVVKLGPGDQIRPVVRSMVNRVFRCVVFVSNPYINSANCGVELIEAVQTPNKLIICFVGDIKQEVKQYFIDLQKDNKHMRICDGFHQLLPHVNNDLLSYEDPSEAYQWWKEQKISITGAPDDVVPDRPERKFAFEPKRIDVRNDIYVGPLYLAGNCKSAGYYFAPPILLGLTLLGVAFVVVDIYHGWANRTGYVYIVYALIFLFTLAPFFEWSKLLDTRRLYCHPSLKPLLASHSFSKVPVPIYVCGDPKNVMVQTLRNFWTLLGNGVSRAEEDKQNDVCYKVPKNAVKIVILDTIAARDRLFRPDDLPGMVKELESSIVMWVPNQTPPTTPGGKKGGEPDTPFTDDVVGQTMMAYLALIELFEGLGIAKSLLSAVSNKVVKLLHGSE